MACDRFENRIRQMVENGFTTLSVISKSLNRGSNLDNGDSGEILCANLLATMDIRLSIVYAII